MDDSTHPDRSARDRLVAELYPPVRRFLTRKLATDEANDLIQETVMAVLRRHEDSALDKPVAFAMRVARNKLVDHYRRRVGAHFDSRQHSVDFAATSMGARMVWRADLERAMAALSLDQQTALEFRYGEGMKLDEVATAMELSVSQIKRYIRDGLDELARKLGSGGADDARVAADVRDSYRRS